MILLEIFITFINECHLVLINKTLMLCVCSARVKRKSNDINAAHSLEELRVQKITTLH